MLRTITTSSFVVVRVLPDVHRCKIRKIVLKKPKKNDRELSDYFFYDLSEGFLVYSEEEIPCTWTLEDLIAVDESQQENVDRLCGQWQYDGENPDRPGPWIIDLKFWSQKEKFFFKLKCQLAEPLLI